MSQDHYMRDTEIDASEAIRVSNELLARLVYFHRDKTPPELAEAIEKSVARQRAAEEEKKRRAEEKKAGKKKLLPKVDLRQVKATYHDPQTLNRVVDRLIADVCFEHRVSRSELFSKTREQRIVDVRYVIYYQMLVKTNWSMTRIGKKIGGRDHSTVSHGVQKYCRMNNLPFPRGVK